MMNIFNNKKGQGLPLTTIIIAAVGLIVLVVLVAIFTGRIGGFGTGVTQAQKITCSDACIASGFETGSKRTGETCSENLKQIFFQGESCCCRQAAT